MSDQPALVHAILQDGKILALIVPLAPLFLPVIGGAVVYMLRARGWWMWSPRKTMAIALVVGGGFSLIVPLNYLFLQVGAATVALIAFLGRHRQWNRIGRAAVVSVQAILVIGVIIVVSAWKPGQGDYLPQVVTGRVLEGLTRINVDDAQGKRSLLVIGVVSSDYAVVATRGYPPRVEYVKTSVVANGQPCQIPPNWNQRSLASIIFFSSSSDGAAGTPHCS